MFTRSITRAFTAAVVAGAATFAMTPSAQAQSAIVRTTTVSLAGLDLTSADGVATLNARVSRAARQVCTTGNRLMLSEKALRDDCARRAIDDAQAPVERAIALAGGPSRVAAARGKITVAAR